MVLSLGGHGTDLTVERGGNLEDRTVLSDENGDQCQLCSGKNDISNHEVLRDGEPDSNSSAIPNKMMRKVCHCIPRLISKFMFMFATPILQKYLCGSPVIICIGSEV